MKRKQGRPVVFSDPSHTARRLYQRIYDKRVALLRKKGLTKEEARTKLREESKKRQIKKWKEKIKQLQKDYEQLEQEE